MVLKLREAVDEDRLIDRSFQGAADEGRRGGGHAFDRVRCSALYCEFYAAYAGRTAVSHYLRPAADIFTACGRRNAGPLVS